MQRKALAIVVALSAVAFEARAETAVAGMGTYPCTQFAKFYQTAPQAAEELFFAWALGWMSALNLGSLDRDRTTQDLSSISVEQQQRFLREYCNEHPSGRYMDGVAALYKTLKPSPPAPRTK
jgi:hypothetical protein